MLRYRSSYAVAALLACFVLAGCRGMTSDREPIQPQLNMFYQERFNTQEANPFFEDGRSDRMPVPGTVARGLLREDAAFYEGRTEEGAYVESLPVELSREFILRGQDRYEVYCAVCHGSVGDGEGIIMVGDYGYTPAPTFHSSRIREIEDGYLYDVITRGVRTMPPYAHQLSVSDRWAVVAYLRALQRSQHATEEDLPAGEMAQIEQRAGEAPEEADEDTPEEGGEEQ